MKKLDRLMLASFIPPFIVTFAIATFVLLMQILWVYIDDIAGKGLGVFMIIELLAYKCVGLVPMAMPLAILLSSVMVLGGLAEHYELSSFKSAGVRLLRVMRMIILFGVASMVVSYYCSNYLIPVANLQFGSRMYDIQQKKPTLSLEAGVFNDDFANFAIHIGRKERDGRTIQNILIYDHTESNSGEVGEIVARGGEMFASPEGNYFIMNLIDGHQYMATRPSGREGDKGYPFVRTSFGSWTKVFDLSEFQLERTNQELFKQNRSMLSSGQLMEAIDSIGLQIARRRQTMANQISNYFYFMKPDTTDLGVDPEAIYSGVDEASAQLAARDSSISGIGEKLRREALKDSAAKQQTVAPATIPTENQLIARDSQVALQTVADTPRLDSAVNLVNSAAYDSAVAQAGTPEPPISARPVRTYRQPLSPMVAWTDSDTVPTITSWIQTLPDNDRKRIVTRARSFARAIYSQSESGMRSLDRTRENEAKFIYELHMKYSMAVVCIIFVFIGAPMGAIVRKGGFGYPILVSVVFFIIFIVLTIFCRKIAETFVVPAAVAAWIPCMVLFPIGMWLTWKAMNDSKLLSTDRLNRLVLAIKKWRKDEKPAIA